MNGIGAVHFYVFIYIPYLYVMDVIEFRLITSVGIESGGTYYNSACTRRVYVERDRERGRESERERSERILVTGS